MTQYQVSVCKGLLKNKIIVTVTKQWWINHLLKSWSVCFRIEIKSDVNVHWCKDYVYCLACFSLIVFLSYVILYIIVLLLQWNVFGILCWDTVSMMTLIYSCWVVILYGILIRNGIWAICYCHIIKKIVSLTWIM